MLQLVNKTPFSTTMVVFPNEAAIDTLYIVVKGTFTMGVRATLADQQTAPISGDVYWSEPNTSSIRYASDLHISKPASDIVMIGQAYAPHGGEATQLDVAVTVGHVGKTVRVFGDRQWQDGRISRPTPFRVMPMVYERAFGGVHYVDGQVTDVEARNPVGCGFVSTQISAAPNVSRLPNLEDMRHLIRDISDRPTPAGFGFCAANWQPRASYVGTYDEEWCQTRAPYLPVDFDTRFLNTAHPDLIYPGFLEGGEPVLITHMHPNGNLEFEVPRANPAARVKLGERTEWPEFRLETLILEPNHLKYSLIWRAAVPCDKQVLSISEVEIGMAHS